MPYRRFRVHVNFRGLRAGELAEIDPSEPGWRPYLDRAWLTPDDDVVEPEPVRQAVPDPAVVPIGEWGLDRGDDDA